MTAIRIKCPTCGEVDLSPDEMSLFMASSGERLSYSFTCPECNLEVDRPASRKTAALLIAAGVETIPLDDDPILATEDRSPDPDAPPLTLDDLIELHFLLQDDHALAELVAH